MTFWFVYDAKSWSPQDAEVAELLPPGISFNRIASFEDNADHPLFALLYHTDGLRGFTQGRRSMSTALTALRKTILSGLALAFAGELAACAPEEGSPEWCENMKRKHKQEWTVREAEAYTKNCPF